MTAVAGFFVMLGLFGLGESLLKGMTEIAKAMGEKK